MTRPYGQMTADETNKFQLVLARWREVRSAIWTAVEAMRLFTSDFHAIVPLASELEAPSDVIPYDSRQGSKSPFASDISYNGLLNEHAIFDALLTQEATESELAAAKVAIGADVAY
jgi:hypothetical protein